MTSFLGVIGLRGGAGRRSFAEVRQAADAARLEPEIPTPPVPSAVAQEALVVDPLAAVVGKNR